MTNIEIGQDVVVSVASRRVQSLTAAVLTSIAWALWQYVPTEAIAEPKPVSPIVGEVTIPKLLRDLHEGLCFDKSGPDYIILHPQPDLFTFYCVDGWSRKDVIVRLK